MPHPSTPLRVMTYNVHSCTGSDGRISTYRVADVIASFEPDVVAIQELDFGLARTNHEHQAAEIARHLNMDFHFHPSIEVQEGKYGNAILSRYPLKLVQAGALPSPWWFRPLEKRGAIWATVDYRGREVQIINTHFGHNLRERLLQAETLLGAGWAAHSSCSPPLVVCGDFNTLPISSVYRRFRKLLKDAQLSIKGRRPMNTYPSRFPVARIDHIFTGAGVEVMDTNVPRNKLTCLASDHLPLIAEIEIR